MILTKYKVESGHSVVNYLNFADSSDKEIHTQTIPVELTKMKILNECFLFKKILFEF